MTKLTYTSNQQLINDAAQMLLENHLHWSGSNEGMPSKDLNNVRGQVIEAYLSGSFTKEEWLEKEETKQKFWIEMANGYFKDAAKLADRKWEAAMTLLGIEQQ